MIPEGTTHEQKRQIEYHGANSNIKSRELLISKRIWGVDYSYLPLFQVGRTGLTTRERPCCPFQSVRFRARLVLGTLFGEMKKDQISNILSPQQRELLMNLLPLARIATSGCSRHLPVRPRTHSVIIGPSGGGKSHLARSIGSFLDLPVLVINVSSWVVLSAKNEPWTYSLICEWLGTLDKKGGIIVLDEVEKSQGEGWMAHVRLEIHDLLDGIIPHAARLPSAPADDGCSFDHCEVLTERLRNHVFIVACGAWQKTWREKSRTLGFREGTSGMANPSREDLLESISPELFQRFRSVIGWLSPMGHSDYLAVSQKIEKQISDPQTRKAWNRLAGPSIAEAVAAGLGMRIFEELMLSAVLESQEQNQSGPNDLQLPEI